MKTIDVYLKDGSVRHFKEVGRAGGSWTISIEFKEGWCVVSDEWGNLTAIPASDVREVKTDNPRGGW